MVAVIVLAACASQPLKPYPITTDRFTGNRSAISGNIECSAATWAGLRASLPRGKAQPDEIVLDFVGASLADWQHSGAADFLYSEHRCSLTGKLHIFPKGDVYSIRIPLTRFRDMAASNEIDVRVANSEFAFKGASITPFKRMAATFPG